jgi:hypothetical protein
MKPRVLSVDDHLVHMLMDGQLVIAVKKRTRIFSISVSSGDLCVPLVSFLWWTWLGLLWPL